MNGELIIISAVSVLFVAFLLFMALRRDPCRNPKCSGRISKMKLIGTDGRFHKVMRCNKCYR